MAERGRPAGNGFPRGGPLVCATRGRPLFRMIPTRPTREALGHTHRSAGPAATRSPARPASALHAPEHGPMRSRRRNTLPRSRRGARPAPRCASPGHQRVSEDRRGDPARQTEREQVHPRVTHTGSSEEEQEQPQQEQQQHSNFIKTGNKEEKKKKDKTKKTWSQTLRRQHYISLNILNKMPSSKHHIKQCLLYTRINRIY